MYFRNSKKLREIIQQRLELRLGKEDTPFIEEILDEEIEITESSENSTLKLLKIINLQDVENIQRIWKIDIDKGRIIKGFSIKDKYRNSDAVLLIERGHNENKVMLDICLIELKSSLQEAKQEQKKVKLSTFSQAEEKFEHTMNWIYILLPSLHSIDSDYHKQEIFVNFYGIICYNENNVKVDSSNLFKIFPNGGLFDCPTFLDDKDKIQVKFIQNPHKVNNSKDFEVSLKDLLD